jgi:hypothetical protein
VEPDTVAHNVSQLWRALVELEQLEWHAMPGPGADRRHGQYEQWEQAIAAAQLAQEAVSEVADQYLHPPALTHEVGRLRGLCLEIENRTAALQGVESTADTDELVRVIHRSVALTRQLGGPGPTASDQE